MKKRLTVLAAFLTAGVIVNAQAYDYLNINNIEARINAHATQFFDPTLNVADFEVPAGSGSISIYSASLWITGQDATSAAHGAVGIFDLANSDWQTGPIMDSVHYVAEAPNWDRVWKVSRSQVDSLASGLYSIIPPVLLDWPAHGNVALGQDFYLAPFEDINSDGIYDPTNGDYPIIKGDQAIWFIINDDKQHLTTNCDRMKIEVHGMAYALSCTSNEALDNTVFLEYKVINRSANTYYSSQMGFWADLDIGCYMDDYIGCDIQRGTFYGYNGDADDEDCVGTFGYGTNTPAQGITFLAGPTVDSDGIDNPVIPNTNDAILFSGIPYEYLGFGYDDGVVDNERHGLTSFVYYNNGVGPTGSPTTCVDFHNYMSGLWLDGTPMTYDNNGYGGTIPISYMFPDDSDPYYWDTQGDTVVPWSEVTAGNFPGDRRALGTSGAFTMEPGEVNVLEMALVFGQDSVIGGIASMQQRVDEIHEMFRNDSTPCGPFIYTSVEPVVDNELIVSIYPNPASDRLTIELGDQNKQHSVRIYSMVGNLAVQETIAGNRYIIPLHGLSDGVYLVEIALDNAVYYDKLIIGR